MKTEHNVSRILEKDTLHAESPRPSRATSETPAARVQTATLTRSNSLPCPQALSAAERRELEQCEAMIRKELGAFIRVGQALLAIRKKKLFREKFATFETYCYAVWGWKRSQAYRMLDAAEVCAALLPVNDVQAPEHERQVRPLVGLPREQAADAWNRACQTAGTGKITGALVRRVVAEAFSPPKSESTPKLDWQLRVKPLLKQAEGLVDSGDKDQVERIITRISLLLAVGQLGRSPGVTPE